MQNRCTVPSIRQINIEKIIENPLKARIKKETNSRRYFKGSEEEEGGVKIKPQESTPNVQ